MKGSKAADDKVVSTMLLHISTRLQATLFTTARNLTYELVRS